MMAMTNVYFRFTYMAQNRDYETLRAGLRINVMANPGIDKLSFELAALGVSRSTAAACAWTRTKKSLADTA